jgi:hypothetical protein
MRVRSEKTVWVRGGCDSYYINRKWGNLTNWVGGVIEYQRRCRRAEVERDFDLTQ